MSAHVGSLAGQPLAVVVGVVGVVGTGVCVALEGVCDVVDSITESNFEVAEACRNIIDTVGGTVVNAVECLVHLHQGLPTPAVGLLSDVFL